MNVEDRLNRLARLASADTNKRFDRLYRELTKTDLLEYAYEQIRNNKGSKTAGIDRLNKFNWDEVRTAQLAEKLRTGEFEPAPVRRILIDKKNKPGQKRPLGIPTFGDRIVQCAIKLMLEALYEPIFFECSHGFRPNRACQTAMQQVVDSPNVRIDWIVEGDIKGCYDNISHHNLLILLQKRIKDDRLLKLIARFLKAGYFERERWNPSKLGTPQGGIISPILANIYLHELDEYVQNEFGANEGLHQTGRERRSRLNKERRCMDQQIYLRRKELRGKIKDDAQRKTLRKEVQELLKIRASLPCSVKPIKPRITYVRYADDFVIILRSMPRSEAVRIKEKLGQWVEERLGLVLSPEKTLITHITDGFKFVGYKVMDRRSKTSQPKVKVMIPYESAQAKLREVKEVCRRLSEPEIVTIRKLNNMLRGWMNYYRCVDVPSKVMSSVLAHTWWIYATYVSRKNGCNIAKATKRWVGRCPVSTDNPRGGQKSWFAKTTNDKGGMVRKYLLCVPVPKCKLCTIATQIRKLKYSPE